MVVKSEMWRTYTADALGTPLPEPPEPQQAWVDKVLAAGQAAVDASVNPPKIGGNGNWFVWDFDAGKYVDTGVAASGGGGGGAVSSVNGKTGAVELTAGDVGAVTSPATAAVGQTVVVKAVDETGKPTAWEAADMVGGSNYELIETIIVGYAITLAEPDDWAENFTAYFTNEGTIRDPDYVALSGDAAPVWEAGKYYSYSADGVTSISRTKEPDGNSYSFKKLAVLCVPVDSSKFRFDLWYGNDSKYNYAYIPIEGLLQGKKLCCDG
ncbi:MAG: hypothetical protein Q4P84_05400 [Elusimicrobiales bacterium]|nr:hypothetical protein [Elusimicrobiales bacterium]